MQVSLPTSIDEALSALSSLSGSEAQVLAGGTDFMVEVNAGHRRPEAVVSLRRVAELRRWERLPGGPGGTGAPGGPGEVRLGAAVTYTDLLQPELAALFPALAQAARTVGSPPIRNAGTIGGNLGTASPAGDTLPVLAALDAVVEVTTPARPDAPAATPARPDAPAAPAAPGAPPARPATPAPGGTRDVPIGEFVTGPKRNALRPGELIVAVRVPVLEGHQEFRKVGVRNAMVIAVANLALALDTRGRTVRCALGSVGPVPIRAREAEAWLAAAIDWDRPQPALATPQDLATFGRLVGEAARPIDDHRGTAAYRRHAVSVLAERAATAALAPPAPEAAA